MKNILEALKSRECLLEEYNDHIPCSGVLVHGDNIQTMEMLISNGKEKIDLIYVDPPFDINSDFWVPSKARHITSRVHAYSDKWGGKYSAMLSPRLKLFHKLLKDSGSLYVHCDFRSTHLIRILLDEIFGIRNYINECIWFYKTGGMPEKLGFGHKHDTIHFVVKNSAKAKWNPQKEKSYLRHKYGFKNIEIEKDSRGYFNYTSLRDVWDIPALRGNQPERVDYPTQKPEALVERIIAASSDEGDFVADFFSGSGTTGSVASRLKRRWLLCDSSPVAILETKKRMLNQSKTSGFVALSKIKPKKIDGSASHQVEFKLLPTTTLFTSFKNLSFWAIGNFDLKSFKVKQFSFSDRKRDLKDSMPPIEPLLDPYFYVLDNRGVDVTEYFECRSF